MIKKFSPEVVVVGSHAPGLFVRVQRVPLPGETVIGWDYHEPMDGGKGSNQAIAASRLGVSTSFVGCIGRDRIGEAGEKWMREAGVNLTYLYHSEMKSSGVGFIILDANSQPAMVTTLGANDELSCDQVENALSQLVDAKIVLTQFEITLEVALHAARVGRQLGIQTIVNPAPAQNLPLADLSVADILVPNEIEARMLLGLMPDDPTEPLVLVSELLAKSAAKCVIITLGDKGMIAADSLGTWKFPAPKVNVVDTSGAGDVFCAALAAALVKGVNIRAASHFACLVASHSVSRPGTIPAFPYFSEVSHFIPIVEATLHG